MLKKIRVLIVGMSLYKGGVEQFVMQFIRNADMDAFTFDFLTFAPLCAFEEELISRGCKVYHATRRGKNPVRSYLEQKKFFISKADVYDFIWLHLSSASDLSTILLAKKHTHARIACHSHGTDFESRDGLVRRIHAFLHKKNQRKLVQNTDIFLACSQKAGIWLYGDIGKKLKLIPNGIRVEDYSFSLEKRLKIRKELKISDEKIALGHVGRLVEVKNHSFLLEIFSAFLKIRPNSILFLVGEGELEESLKEKAKILGIEKQVMFLGFRDDVSGLLQAFDAFLLPSFAEGFPITLVEAQASGLPCIISDTITDEVDVTGLVSFLSLDLTAEEWAQEVEKRLSTDRNSPMYVKKLESAGYTVKATAEILTKEFGG